MVTYSVVRELFDYSDGDLICKKPRGRARCGCVAGSVNKNSGYVIIVVYGKSYRAHRLIWLWYHGYMPENEIDHINRNRADNRIENLREASRSCNIRNSSTYKTNTTGVSGVSLLKSGKYRVQIWISNRKHNVGTFIDFDEAVLHRLAAEQCLVWERCVPKSSAYAYAKDNILI